MLLLPALVLFGGNLKNSAADDMLALLTKLSSDDSHRPLFLATHVKDRQLDPQATTPERPPLLVGYSPIYLKFVRNTEGEAQTT